MVKHSKYSNVASISENDWNDFWVNQAGSFMAAAGLSSDDTVYFPGTDYEITGYNVAVALGKFIAGVKADGVWTKLTAFYPLLGVNYTSAKFNIINPLDTDAAYRLEEGVACTYSGLGVTFNGTTNYLKTKIIPSVVATNKNFAGGAYVMTTPETGNKGLFGCASADWADRFYIAPARFEVILTIVLGGMNNILSMTPPVDNVIQLDQFYCEDNVLRIDINGRQYLQKILSDTDAMPDNEIYLGCFNAGGSPDWFNAYTLGGWYFGTNLTSFDNSNIAKRTNQLLIDLKRVPYSPISKTITFDNTGNEALLNYIAEIDITAAEFSFENMCSGNHMNFIDSGSNLPCYIAKYDKINNKIKAFVKIDIPADTIKNITLNTGVDSKMSRNFLELMSRKSALSITKELYNMDSVHDSMGVGADITLVGSSIIDSQFGKVLDCNGIDSYATISRDFPSLDTYDMCTISFNFCFKHDKTVMYSHDPPEGYVNHCIFSKYVDSTHYIKIQLNLTKKIIISTYGGVYEIPQIGFAKFEAHSVVIRINKAYLTMQIDNVIGFTVVTTAIAGGQPFTLGAYNDGSISDYADVYIWDLEFIEGYYTPGKMFARNNGVPQKGINEIAKWEYVSDVPDTEPDGIVRQEPNIITVGSELHLYSTDKEVAIPGMSRRISINDGITWSAPVRLVIDGLTVNSQRPFVFQDSGKIYIIYQKNGLYISESIDGINFTNSQQWMVPPEGFTTLENSCVYYDSDLSKWYGVVEGWDGTGWGAFVISGDTLLSMSKLYTIESIIERKKSGPHIFKINGVWQMWTQSNREIFRHKNEDITTDTWVAVYDKPIFELTDKWGQEQQADISICEKDGVCYAAVNNSGDITGTTGNTSILKYDGTIEQLVSDLTKEIT